MGNEIEAKIGDIFQFKVDGDKYAYGQVMGKRFTDSGVLYVAVYEPVTGKGDYILDKVLASKIIFLTHIGDEKIWHGHWEVIENRLPDLSRVFFPCYKYGEEEVYLEDYEAKSKRKALPDEAKALDFRFSVSAIRIEKAFRAYLRLEPWGKAYDKMTYEHVKATSEIRL